MSALESLSTVLPESGPAVVARDALREAQDTAFRVGELMRQAGALEADRHARKEAAIRRLMEPKEGEAKGLARTPAEELVNSDPDYNAYLRHQQEVQAKLEETRESLRVLHATARLATAVLEQGVAA